VILIYSLSYLTMSYPGVTIKFFICYWLGLTSLWAILVVWSLILSGSLVRVKIEVSALAPEHIINPGELQFLIGILADWQSSIRLLCLNQAK
jgi:hypothetical protein